jgi:hypothetical protein
VPERSRLGEGASEMSQGAPDVRLLLRPGRFRIAEGFAEQVSDMLIAASAALRRTSLPTFFAWSFHLSSLLRLARYAARSPEAADAVIRLS